MERSSFPRASSTFAHPLATLPLPPTTQPSGPPNAYRDQPLTADEEALLAEGKAHTELMGAPGVDPCARIRLALRCLERVATCHPAVSQAKRDCILRGFETMKTSGSRHEFLKDLDGRWIYLVRERPELQHPLTEFLNAVLVGLKTERAHGNLAALISSVKGNAEYLPENLKQMLDQQLEDTACFLTSREGLILHGPDTDKDLDTHLESLAEIIFKLQSPRLRAGLNVRLASDVSFHIDHWRASSFTELLDGVYRVMMLSIAADSEELLPAEAATIRLQLVGFLATCEGLSTHPAFLRSPVATLKAAVLVAMTHISIQSGVAPPASCTMVSLLDALEHFRDPFDAARVFRAAIMVAGPDTSEVAARFQKWIPHRPDHVDPIQCALLSFHLDPEPDITLSHKDGQPVSTIRGGRPPWLRELRAELAVAWADEVSRLDVLSRRMVIQDAIEWNVDYSLTDIVQQYTGPGNPTPAHWPALEEALRNGPRNPRLSGTDHRSNS